MPKPLSDADGEGVETIRHAFLSARRISVMLSSLHHPVGSQERVLAARAQADRLDYLPASSDRAVTSGKHCTVGTEPSEKKESNSFELISTVHESEAESLIPDIEPEHKFEVTLEPDTLTDEKFALFANYQRHVHHETSAEISRSGFERFLCNSPLHGHADADGKPLGSYHQCYRLDGRLIAMAVLDLLPHAVSGVYFVYHSDFEKWSFGKLSALRETALAVERGYGYYYMGYYIHGCKKMRYKGDYRPQYVLDYHCGEWDVLDDEMRRLMETRKWASMSLERARRAGAAAAGHNTTAVNGEAAQTQAGATKERPEKDEAGDPVLYPTPLAAMHSGASLLTLGMPGTLTAAELADTVQLDTIKISLGGTAVHQMQDIVSWDRGSVMDPATIKGRVAEYAAAVGPEVAAEVTVDFSRGG
ncbi:Arginyl-tRNA--protein transferase 1 [Teratosphaeriaceae sp. CCFEE 6253]|nr:Arginyl-tRNA--protein transferase 1 [Teratosphaeriaceae sp. CCFEE 6253]